MAQQQQNAASVPLAHGGPITDEVLAQLTNAAQALQDDTLDSIGAMFLIQNLPQALRELAQRRKAMGAIATIADFENVVVLDGHRT